MKKKPAAKLPKKSEARRFYSIEEFCSIVKISVRTYYRWRAEGLTPVETQVGARIWIHHKDFEAWGERQ